MQGFFDPEIQSPAWFDPEVESLAWFSAELGPSPSATQTERECTANANVASISSPADWTTVGTADPVGAVAVLHDAEYITADSIGLKQWYNVGSTGSDTTQLISKVTVTVCSKQSVPGELASFNSLMKVPSHDSPGFPDGEYTGGVYAVRCNYACTSTHYYSPEPWNTKSAPDWTWADVNDLQVGVEHSEGRAGPPGTQGYPTTGAVDVGRIFVTVWCGSKWNPCPRCCCCCLCPSPVVTWSGITTDTTTLGGIPITTDKITTTVPYAGDPPGLGGAGCYWAKIYDPPLIIGNDSVNVTLVLHDIAIVGNVIQPSPNPCSTVYFHVSAVATDTSIGIGPCVLAYPTRLWCCNPYHFSSSDTVDFSGDILSTSCGWDCDPPGRGLSDCGTVSIKCPVDTGGTDLGECPEAG